MTTIDKTKLEALRGLSVEQLTELLLKGDISGAEFALLMQWRTTTPASLSIGPSGKIVLRASGHVATTTQSPEGWRAVFGMKDEIMSFVEKHPDVVANQKQWARDNPEKAAEIQKEGGVKNWRKSKQRN